MANAQSDAGGLNDYSRFKPWLLLIPPALVAGVFSLLPNIYSSLTSPDAKLTYYVVTGPALPSGDGEDRIYYVTVTNAGDTKISGIKAIGQIRGGSFQQVVSSSPERDDLEVGKVAGSVRMTVPNLLRGESAAMTMLVRTQRNGASPTFNVRSNDVKGVLEYPSNIANSRAKNTFTTIAAILAGLGAVLGALSSRLILRRNRKTPDRPEVIWYVVQSLRLDRMRPHLPANWPEMRYSALSDLLERCFEEGDDKEKRLALAGLKSLFLAPMIAQNSRAIIIEDLKRLDPSFNDEAEVQLEALRVESRTQQSYRENVRGLISNARDGA